MSKNYKYTFRAKPDRDDIIIDWLERIKTSDKSYYIREALREYLTIRIPQGSNTADISNSSNTISKINNKVEPSNHEEIVSENSDSTLETNLRSWIE